MASHWLTNRGKLRLLQGAWDDDAVAWKIGFVEGSAVPATMDTEAEIQDLNTVSELLALAGVAEPTATNYARMTLTRTAASEDDANNRVNIDAPDVSLTAVANNGDSVIAGWVQRHVDGTDANDELISVWTLDTAVPFNGSDVTGTITDLFRAS